MSINAILDPGDGGALLRFVRDLGASQSLRADAAATATTTADAGTAPAATGTGTGVPTLPWDRAVEHAATRLIRDLEGFVAALQGGAAAPAGTGQAIAPDTAGDAATVTFASLTITTETIQIGTATGTDTSTGTGIGTGSDGTPGTVAGALTLGGSATTVITALQAFVDLLRAGRASLPGLGFAAGATEPGTGRGGARHHHRHDGGGDQPAIYAGSGSLRTTNQLLGNILDVLEGDAAPTAGGSDASGTTTSAPTTSAADTTTATTLAA